jgi:hypothetical protein
LIHWERAWPDLGMQHKRTGVGSRRGRRPCLEWPDTAYIGESSVVPKEVNNRYA